MSVNKFQLQPFISAVLLYLFCNPYFVWNAWHSADVHLIMTGLMALLFTINLDIKSNSRLPLFVLLFLLLVFSAYVKGNNLIGFVASVMTCVLPFSKESFAKKSFDYFVTIYTCIIGVAALMFLLALIGEAPLGGSIEPLNELKSYTYLKFPLLVIANDGNAYRFSGPFDEPGVVGTINAIILTIGKFNLKDKKLIVIFITGFLSLSFFYYIIVSVYYVINYFLVARNKQKSLFMILLFVAFVVFTFNNHMMNEILWSRFRWDSEAGKLTGDNRIGDAGLDFFNSILGTKEFYFGSDNYDAFTELVVGSASFISIIVRYGIVFCGLFIYLFAYYGWKYKKEMISYVLFLFVFITTIYQRPFIFDPSYMFLFSMLATTCGSSFMDVRQRGDLSNNIR